jgi:chemotaxis protein histidine kinase CheA
MIVQNVGHGSSTDMSFTVPRVELAKAKRVLEPIVRELGFRQITTDAAIAKVRFDNVTAMQKRIQSAFEAINKLGESKNVSITARFLDLKLQELSLVHEQQEKKQAIREEERRIREEQREAEKAEREIAQAQAQADKDAEKEQRALEQAKAELAKAAGGQEQRLQVIVDQLESRLAEALDRKAKAMARAQFTRSGHVYVISNVGTYGPDVFKIGMTRRLDPYERIRELGDSSVPFFYDVHAIIYAEDAPGLEGALHRALADRRLNLVNMRREFFRASLEEIRAVVAAHHGLVSFVLEPEAEEYRKSEALRAAINDGTAAVPTAP